MVEKIISGLYAMLLVWVSIWLCTVMLSELALRGYVDIPTQVGVILGTVVASFAMWRARPF